MTKKDYKAIRQAHGFTIQQMATEIGMSHHAVQSYESGRATPKDRVKDIYRQLAMDASYKMEALAHSY